MGNSQGQSEVRQVLSTGSIASVQKQQERNIASALARMSGQKVPQDPAATATRERKPGAVSRAFPAREFPEEFRPTAAVVGAGIAGLHCAWELARLGFKVTVFEQYRDAGEGASKFDSGLVGADVPFTPAVWHAKSRAEYLRSLLPFSRGVIVPQETPLGAIMRESWRTWVRGRRNVLTTESHIRSVAKDLARESAEIVDGLIALEPDRFAKCVVSQGTIAAAPAAPEAESSAESAAALVPAASAKTTAATTTPWRCIDTGAYCKELKDVLEEEYGVNFRFRSVITRLQWRINSTFEFATSVIHTDLETKETRPMTADLIVVAAGSMSMMQRDTGAGEGYPLPLLSTAAYGLDVPASRVPALLAKLSNEQQQPTAAAQNAAADSASLASRVKALMPCYLSERMFLRVGPTPHISAPSPLAATDADQGGSAAAAAAAAEPRVRISGLISLMGDDVRRGPVKEPSASLAQIAPRLRADAGVTDLDRITLLQADDPASGITGFRYARGFTADGLPIVSKAGNAKNVFLCCGFGDDAATFAPAGAKWLAEIVMKKRTSERIPPPPPHTLTEQAQLEHRDPALMESVLIEEQMREEQRRKRGDALPPHMQKGNPLALDRFYKFDHWMQPVEVVEWQRRWYKTEKTLEEVGQPIINLLYDDFMDSAVGRFIFMRSEKKEIDS